MLVLHANWIDGSLRWWGESQGRFRDWVEPRADSHSSLEGAVGTMTVISETHPFAATAHELREALVLLGLPTEALLTEARDESLSIRLPRDHHGPLPSDRLGRAAGAVDDAVDPWLGEFELPSLGVRHEAVLAFVARLEDEPEHHGLEFGPSVKYWMAVVRLVLDLLADQRFIPTLMQTRGNGVTAAWQPWLHDEDARRRVGALLNAMPPVVRAVVGPHQGRAWPLLDDALRKLTDSAVRAALHAEQFIDAIDGRPPTDPHVAWLSGLLDGHCEVKLVHENAATLLRDAELWVRRLDDGTQHRPMKLCLRLNEPDIEPDSPASPAGSAGADVDWWLSLHLQSADDPDHLIDAEQIWLSGPVSGKGASSGSAPQELLLAELGRVSSLYPRIESALQGATPTGVNLNTLEAYEFLRDIKPILEESGFGVIVPAWWNQPTGRLAARLHVDSPTIADVTNPSGGTAPASSMLGLNSLVHFRWQIAIGEQPLTAEEFAALAKQSSPLVRVRGKWIEISPEQLRQAKGFLEQSPEGEMTLLEAIHLAYGADAQQIGLPVFGMDATGWVADVLGASSEDHRMPNMEQPAGFAGTLRPYQKSGLSWLAFLDRFGLGACLADDMGLGKTIQLIALLQNEREQPAADSSPGPTLLIVPTSVVSNWVREIARFAKALRVHVHHGPERPMGDPFVELVKQKDIVITTYPLVSRDQETLKRVMWHRVALDEAQYIKNPPTKQTVAISSLHAPRRVALTGTPVENRLSELWSIMEFCNPGYFGPAAEFRRRFAVPIERHRSQRQSERLRQMVRPFVLRRVKTDPTVIDDLPPLVETKEYATLTAEQAALYQQVVGAMLGEVEKAEGIQRRGLVLATLVKLKQICNHPMQAMGEAGKIDLATLSAESPIEQDADAPALVTANGNSLATRSGKARRLITMLEEVLSTGEKALIFTQFRQMGHLLTAMIQQDLDTPTLFLHGGTPAAKRQHLIDRFQDDKGGVPIFVLSLKAGGLGLNLTAASHVFHYDRWWNPAVENQATDRAFRIGQTRTVQVHKFVCVGTLEERIDQMIEQKTELARNIIGSGEQWLTELSTGQLREMLTLRSSALEGES